LKRRAIYDRCATRLAAEAFTMSRTAPILSRMGELADREVVIDRVDAGQ